jgi:hypothetical protein
MLREGNLGLKFPDMPTARAQAYTSLRPFARKEQ